MAYGFWPDLTPGAKYGPCAEPCKHRDCAQLRNPEYSKCARCEKPLKADDRFYFDEHNRPVHAAELEHGIA